MRDKLRWRFHLAAVLLTVLWLLPAAPVAALDLNPSNYFTYNYNFSLSQSTVYLSQSFTMTVTGHAECKQDLPITITSATVTGSVIGRNTSTGDEVTLTPAGYSVTFTGFPQVVGETMDASQSVSLSFPSGTAAGTYQVVGVLGSASVKAVLNFDVSNYFPATQDIGTVTYTATAAPSSGGGGGGGGSGGGGGGGGAPLPPATPELPAGSTTLEGNITDLGVTAEAMQAVSEDAKATLSLAARTKALKADGKALDIISIVESELTTTLPATQTVVSTVYEMGPAGATFSPPADLTLKYDPARLPDGTDDSNLALGVFNPETGQFDRIPDCVVNTDNGTVTGPIAHFSVFAVVAGTAPANITMSDITVTPAEVTPGEEVVVSVTVYNSGDLPGGYSVALDVNGEAFDTRPIYLEGGETTTVEFTVSRSIKGTHSVDIGGLTTSFTVTSAPEPEPTTSPEMSTVETPDTTEPPPTPDAVEVPEPRSWTWLLGVIGGADLVVLVLILVFARRRA